jgi:hypothetical protein
MILVNDTYTMDTEVNILHNGFAVFENVKIANSGNIQTYKNFELSNLPEYLAFKQEIKIYRPKDEIEKSVKSFEFLTVTDTHPWDNVSAKNYKDYAVGMTTDASFEENHIVSRSIVVTDSAMIVELQASGESKELSCGYFAEFVYEAGTTESGELYDGYMKNLQGNHVAIVERGRCGGSCRLWE